MTKPLIRNLLLRHFLVGPFIWGMIVPVVFADICLEIYYCCPIQHLREHGYIPAEHELRLAKYGNGAALRRRYARFEKMYGKPTPGA